jgi:predicted DCC family thiol-disulfide oxidoreductase YuxK
MTNAVAQSARFVAFEHSAPVVLRDVEDLHDADLDLVLADKLADAYDAADVAIALARLLGEPGLAALVAHDLGAQAAELAG